MASKWQALNIQNLTIAKAMALYWQDVVDGRRSRVLWEELPLRVRDYYTVKVVEQELNETGNVDSTNE